MISLRKRKNNHKCGCSFLYRMKGSTPFQNPIIKKADTHLGICFLAEDEGFEPPQTESESGVLPLHKSSMRGTKMIILKLPKKSSPFFKNFHFSSQGKFLPARTTSFRYLKVFSSPSSRSMVRIYSSSRWVCSFISRRSLLLCR